MRLIEIWYRLTAMLRRRRLERDLDDEVAFHIAMHQRDAAAAGASSVEARLEAERRFGSATLIKEQMRETWTFPLIESLWQDAAYGARSLLAQPGFTATVVVVLATVIGLNTTFFTILAGVVLRPWPGVAEPSGVVRLYLLDPSGQSAGFSLADYRRLTEGTTSLSGIAAMRNDSVRVGADDAMVPAETLLVSGNFFTVLGITMTRGRGFAPSDDRLGAPEAVTVLGYDFWQSRFGGDPSVVGRSVRINDVPFTVVGVASRDFGSAEPAYDKKLFLPMSSLPLLRPNDRSTTDILYKSDSCCSDVVGRLAPGIARGEVRAELELVSRSFVSFSGNTARGVTVTGTEFLSAPGRGDTPQAVVTATLLIVALMLVWLIACANVGNLLLARAAGRGREIGVRLALGASRGRLVRQLLTEGLVLAVAAGAIGIGVAYELPFVIFRVVAARGTAPVFPFRVTPDAIVLAYAVLLAGLSSVAFGLAPALFATRADVVRALNQRERGPVAGFSLAGLLLAVQVAVSVILLVSAGLLARAVQRQAGFFDPGFVVEGMTVLSFELPEGVYDRARSTAFFADLSGRLHDLPIEGFTFASHEPFSLYRQGTLFHLPGETREQARMLSYLDVSPNYLSVLDIPLVAGRYLETADAGRPIVVVNESMARRYWPGESPIGKTFFMRPQGPVDQRVARQIVGVARNVHTSVSVDDVAPMFYSPLAPGMGVFDFISRDPRASQAPKLLLKTNGPAPSAEIARIAAQLDSRVRIQAAPLSAALDSMLASARWSPILAGTLGGFALVLAAVGMFGVFAYAVRQRTREIGIRMALGARPAGVVRLVLAGHSRAVLAGLGIGMVGAIAASNVLRSRLHGLSPFDPIAYLGVAGLLAVAALAASYVPARRATRINPIDALRCD